MTWLGRLTAHRRKPKRGQTFVIFALVFTVLMGFAGLALDASHSYLVQHTAQKAADAAALAAGKRLAGTTQSAPLPDSNDPSAVAAHDFAAADGFMTTRNTVCDTTTTSGGLTRFITTWYDMAGVVCGANPGFNTSVSIAVPPYQLTPHCQVTPYNCMQVTIQQRVPNFVMSALGFPTTLVRASATVFAQPSGAVYSIPPPLAFYLYEPTRASCAPGHQCFDQTRPPSRSQLSCSGGNCPTFWVQRGAGALIIGVDGSTLNPPADTVAAESNGDMVLGDLTGFCDPYGGRVSGCLGTIPLGRQGFAIAPGATLYCLGFGAGGANGNTGCTPTGPGGYTLSALFANETGFTTQTWQPRVDLTGLPTCGGLLLNGDTVANSLISPTCAPPASDPYTVLPGIYTYMVANHGLYHFEPGIYDITGTAPVNSNVAGTANGIDHSGETSADWDLCTMLTSPTTLSCPNLTAGVWIGHGTMNHGTGAAPAAFVCAGSGAVDGGGGDLTQITAHGVVFRFESTAGGFVSTNEVSFIGMTSPGLGQMRQVGGAPLLFDLENNGFIHIDASSLRQSQTPELNSFGGIIYQTATATAGGVEVNPGSPTRYGSYGGGITNSMITGQIFAYSFTTFGNYGAFNFSDGTGGAATPTVTTSGHQEAAILTSSTLVAGTTAGTESLVVTYKDEWALDAYDVYVKVNNGGPIFFSEGIWNPAPGTGASLPPNSASNIPSDTHPAYPTGTEAGAVNYRHSIDSNGDPLWTMTYTSTFAPGDNSTFTIQGDWAWGHEKDIPSARRGNDFATLTYTFPVPAGSTVTISMFMTDGDHCGDYVTTSWTFHNIGTPSAGTQIIGSVRLEQ